MRLIHRVLGLGTITMALATSPVSALRAGGPPAPAASATTLISASSFSWQGCGGSAFFTCASAAVAITTSSQVTMTITNLSGSFGTFTGTVFTQIGLFNLPTGSTYLGGLQVYDASNQAVNGWQLGTSGLSGSGIQKVVLGVDTQQGINAGLGAGGTYTFVFSIGNLPTNFTLAPDVAIHGQGGPNSCSTKLVVSGGTANSGPLDPSCVSTVPEPMTVALLATGLLGLAGAGYLRRRRQSAA